MSSENVFSGVHEVSVELPTGDAEAPGLVVKWRRRGAALEGLVSREVDGRVVTEWLPALLLSPKSSLSSIDDASTDTVGSQPAG